MLRAVGDLDGRNFLVTGANTGIGLETVRTLAARGGRIWLAGRSEPKTREVMGRIAAETQNSALHYLELDLGSLSSVRRCADAFLVSGEPLHVLINNAGLAGQRGMTDSGFELAFGTNHIGPFLLTDLLLDRLRASAPARIVTVASDAHFSANGIDYEAVRRPTQARTGFPEYAVSKLANVLHSRELSRRLEGTGVTTYSLHPGDDRVGHLAQSPVAGPATDEAADALDRGGCANESALRDSPGARGRERAVLRELRAQRAQLRRDPGARAGAVGAQRELGRRLSTCDRSVRAEPTRGKAIRLNWV